MPMLLGTGAVTVTRGDAFRAGLVTAADVGSGVPAAALTDRLGVLEAIFSEGRELDHQVDRISRPGCNPAAFLFFLHEHRFVIYGFVRTRTHVCKVPCRTRLKFRRRAKCKLRFLLRVDRLHEQAFVLCSYFAGTFGLHLPRLPKLNPTGARALMRGSGGWISLSPRTSRFTTPWFVSILPFAWIRVAVRIT